MADKNKEIENISDQFKNKSSWMDSFFGKIRTDQPDNYYENLQTKVSIKFNKNKKFLFVLKKLYRIYYNIKGPFHTLPDFLILGPGACGTTSLVELYLRSNENIFPSKNNEIFFFDINYDKCDQFRSRYNLPTLKIHEVNKKIDIVINKLTNNS